MRLALLMRFLLPAMLLSSCIAPQKDRISTDAYFDFAGYFRSEAARLSAAGDTILKQASFNGQSDEKIIIADSAFWHAELAPFAVLDLNKPVYRNSYTCNRSVTAQGDSLFGYLPADPGNTSLAIREATIRKSSSNKVLVITAVIHREDLMSITDQALMYVPGSYYSISGSQKIRYTGIRSSYALSGHWK